MKIRINLGRYTDRIKVAVPKEEEVINIERCQLINKGFKIND